MECIEEPFHTQGNARTLIPASPDPTGDGLPLPHRLLLQLTHPYPTSLCSTSFVVLLPLSSLCNLCELCVFPKVKETTEIHRNWPVRHAAWTPGIKDRKSDVQGKR